MDEELDRELNDIRARLKRIESNTSYTRNNSLGCGAIILLWLIFFNSCDHNYTYTPNNIGPTINATR